MNPVRLYSFSEPCPYLAEKTSSGEFMEEEEFFGGYETLLTFGWRRSGRLLYRYRCPGCSLCTPVRLPVARLHRSKRFARLSRLNHGISLKLCPAEFKEEYFRLYENYVRIRHDCRETATEESFRSLFDAPMAALTEYRDPSDRLCALGFLDILPRGLSSVYFAFDPGEARRSLGAWSIYLESALAAAMGKDWYYLGFWVPEAPKMDYKADFSPIQLALPSGPPSGAGIETPKWIEFAGKAEALLGLAAAAHR